MLFGFPCCKDNECPVSFSDDFSDNILDERWIVDDHAAATEAQGQLKVEYDPDPPGGTTWAAVGFPSTPNIVPVTGFSFRVKYKPVSVGGNYALQIGLSGPDDRSVTGVTPWVGMTVLKFPDSGADGQVNAVWPGCSPFVNLLASTADVSAPVEIGIDMDFYHNADDSRAAFFYGGTEVGEIVVPQACSLGNNPPINESWTCRAFVLQVLAFGVDPPAEAVYFDDFTYTLF